MKLNNTSKFIISVVICELAGIIGSIFTIPSIKNWYAFLQKPSFSPPNWIFGPVWTTLFFLMGIALFLIWTNKKTDKKHTQKAVTIFGLQFILNILWTLIFFGLHNPFWALIEIKILWLTILWTILVFYKISKPAAYLLIPYLAWVSFAVYLNYAFWTLN